MIEYEMLHYRADLRDHPEAQPGALLGNNEIGWPWQVIDCEYAGGRTTVHLQTATPEAVQKAMHRVHVHHPLPRHVRRQQARREGRL